MKQTPRIPSGSNLPQGVLEKSYAEARRKNSVLQFRLAYRAFIAAEAIKTYGLAPSSEGYTVLDLGAAEGATLQQMASVLPLKRGIGIEFNPELVNESNALLSNIKLMVGDVQKLPTSIAAHSFDAVTALAVIEHIDAPHKMIAQAYRVLKPGGVLVITTPRPLWDKVATSLGLLPANQHVEDFSKQALKKLSSNTQLSLATFRYFMWSPLAVLPYFAVPVNISWLNRFERLITRIKLFNFLFVNQLLVLKKPLQ